MIEAISWNDVIVIRVYDRESCKRERERERDVYAKVCAQGVRESKR